MSSFLPVFLFQKQVLASVRKYAHVWKEMPESPFVRAN